jgi:hypothetical protein
VDDVLERRDRGLDLCYLGTPVHRLLAVGVAGDGDEHLGLDLAEPVDDAHGAELRGAAGPHGAQARGGEEGDQGLGSVGQVADHPVADTDTEPLEPHADPAYLLLELRVAKLQRWARLRVRHDGDLVRVVIRSEAVLGVVECGTREPPCLRHGAALQHGSVRRVRLDAEVVPHGGPEVLQAVDRPLVELVPGGQLEVALGGQPTQEALHLSPGDTIWVGLVDQSWLVDRRAHAVGPDALTFGARPARNALMRPFASALLWTTADMSDSMRSPVSGDASAMRGNAWSTA